MNVEQILNDTILELRNLESNLLTIPPKVSGDNFQIQCPYHKNGEERHPSAGIHRDTGIFHCFSCGITKSLDELIFDLLGTDGNRLIRNGSFDRPPVELDFKEKEEFLDKEEIKKYLKIHPYLEERGISREVIKYFNIGYYDGYIMFPILDYKGNLLYFAKRSLRTKFYSYPVNAYKPLYGAYQLIRRNVKTTYVCEGIIDALTLWSWNKPAIALGGTGSHRQIEDMLNLPFRHYILALDGDSAGEKGTERLIKGLSGKKLISKVAIPKDKDVNDLTREEFERLEEELC